MEEIEAKIKRRRLNMPFGQALSNSARNEISQSFQNDQKTLLLNKKRAKASAHVPAPHPPHPHTPRRCQRWRQKEEIMSLHGFFAQRGRYHIFLLEHVILMYVIIFEYLKFNAIILFHLCFPVQTASLFIGLPHAYLNLKISWSKRFSPYDFFSISLSRASLSDMSLLYYSPLSAPDQGVLIIFFTIIVPNLPRCTCQYVSTPKWGYVISCVLTRQINTIGNTNPLLYSLLTSNSRSLRHHLFTFSAKNRTTLSNDRRLRLLSFTRNRTCSIPFRTSDPVSCLRGSCNPHVNRPHLFTKINIIIVHCIASKFPYAVSLPWLYFGTPAASPQFPLSVFFFLLIYEG